HRDTHPFCTADGQWVIYSCLMNNWGTVCKVPLAGGEASPLGETLDHGINLVAVSPDDRFYVYQFRDEANKLFNAIRALKGGPVLKLLEAHSMYDLYWSADGRNLLYADGRDIWLQPLEGGPPKRLTHFAAEHVSFFAQSRA